MKLMDIIKKHDWLVKPTPKEIADGDLEIVGYTPAGENYCLFLQGETEGEMLKSLQKLADSFDVDEHVEMWIPRRGEGGCPSSIRELVEDAEWIENELEQMAKEVEEV